MSADAAVERAEEAAQRWRAALRAHQFAAPDDAFGERLAQLANAAEEQESAFRAADREGLSARPVPGARAAIQPPPELRPDSGRRGPVELWERFDRGVAALGDALEGTSSIRVSHAYGELSKVLRLLADEEEQYQVEARRRASRGMVRRAARGA